jgi:hypothetical protein
MIFLLLQRLGFYMGLLTFKGEGGKLNWSLLWCKVSYLKEFFFCLVYINPRFVNDTKNHKNKS